MFVALVIAAVVGIRYALFRPKAVDVTVFTVRRGRVEESVTNSKAGTVKVRQRAKLSPAIGGRVTYLGAREGARVKAGTVLLRLDDSDMKASLKLAQQSAASSQAATKEACVGAQLASRELERNRTLNQQGIVSAAQLDQLSNKRDITQAQCEASMAEARRASAAVDVARANLEKTEIRAPFDGIIVQLTTELGEWVTPSPPGVPIPPVIDILDDHSIYVQAPIDESDAGKLKTGLPVRISLDPFPDQTFPGKVTRIAPFVQDLEGQNRTVDVEAEFQDSSMPQKPLAGTSADLEIILRSEENVLRIPTHALLESDHVLLVQGNKLVERTVQTGLRNWEFVEVKSGLQEGDQIAVSLERSEVKAGALVHIAGEATK